MLLPVLLGRRCAKRPVGKAVAPNPKKNVLANKIPSPSSYRPTQGHTELEEELHETAHIDYERVAIVRSSPFSTNVKLPCCFNTFASPIILTMKLTLKLYYRLETLPLLPSMKMPWYTKPDLPSPPVVL